jgi:hypothetical protein
MGKLILLSDTKALVGGHEADTPHIQVAGVLRPDK